MPSYDAAALRKVSLIGEVHSSIGDKSMRFRAAVFAVYKKAKQCSSM